MNINFFNRGFTRLKPHREPKPNLFTKLKAALDSVVSLVNAACSQEFQKENPDNKEQTNQNVYEILDRVKRVGIVGFMSMMTMAATTVPARADTLNPTVDIDTLFGGVVDIICQIAMYMGGFLVIAGAISLILAYKDENSEQQTRAVRLIVVGAALMGLKPLLHTAGILK